MSKGFSEGTIVKDKETGGQGVVVSDPFGCCGSNEVPVVWDGDDSFVGTDYRLLEVVGPYKPQIDPQRCGTGRGEDCCIYLVCGAEGFECQRFGSLRYNLIFRKEKMNAKRQPERLYPNCLLDK